MPLHVLGGGSNLLVSDEGVRGMVIELSSLKGVRLNRTYAYVDAGAKLSSVVAQTTRAGLGGMEGLAGIPGTVGGAICMNAGGRYGETGDTVERVVLVTREGELRQVSHEELRFGYRHSQLDGAIVVEVVFKLTRGDAGALTATQSLIGKGKIAAQPYNQHSAGCIFRNPAGAECGAGALIDRAGLKGERVGDAQISDRHANFIVNLGAARCRDVETLIERAQKRVHDAFGVELQTEVKRWAA